MTKVAGRKVEWTSEVVEFEQDRRVEIRSIEAPMDFPITWSYHAEGGGTRVGFTQEVPNVGGFFGELGDGLVTKMYSRDVRANLENLEAPCEDG